MKAAYVTKYGGPEVLEIKETGIPKTGPGEVLIQVKAIGLNFAEIFMRLGVYPNTPKPPFILGMEFAGVVAECGTEVSTLVPGDRVMGFSRTSSHAEYLVVNELMAGKIPGSMTFEEAAAFLVTSLTAYHGLITLGQIKEGDQLLLHAAAGGVGLTAIQIAKHRKAIVFGTVGSDIKRKTVEELNIDHVINYRSENFADVIKKINGGYGIDVVMDSVAGKVFRPGWKLLAPMGRYIIYGLADVMGPGSFSYLRATRAIANMPPVLLTSLISSNRTIAGFNLSTLTNKTGYLREAGKKLFDFYEQGVIKPIIGKTFPFERIVDAHIHLQNRESIGKVVVTLDHR